MYAHVTDGQVDQVGLPPVWVWPDGRQTALFQYATDDELTEAGWHPVTEVRPPLSDGETYRSPVFTVDGDTVTATYPVEPVPPLAADPAEVLAQVGAELAAISSNATLTQIRSALRSLGQVITNALEGGTP